MANVGREFAGRELEVEPKQLKKSPRVSANQESQGHSSSNSTPKTPRRSNNFSTPRLKADSINAPWERKSNYSSAAFYGNSPVFRGAGSPSFFNPTYYGQHHPGFFENETSTELDRRLLGSVENSNSPADAPLSEKFKEIDQFFEELGQREIPEDLKNDIKTAEFWVRYALGSIAYEEEKTDHIEAVCLDLEQTRINLEREANAQKSEVEKEKVLSERLLVEVSKLNLERDQLIGKQCLLEEQVSKLGSAKSAFNVVDAEHKNSMLSLEEDNQNLRTENQRMDEELKYFGSELATTKVKYATLMEDQDRLRKLVRYYSLHIEQCQPSLIIPMMDKQKLDELDLVDSPRGLLLPLVPVAEHRSGGALGRLKDWAFGGTTPRPSLQTSLSSATMDGISTERKKKWKLGRPARSPPNKDTCETVLESSDPLHSPPNSPIHYPPPSPLNSPHSTLRNESTEGVHTELSEDTVVEFPESPLTMRSEHECKTSPRKMPNIPMLVFKKPMEVEPPKPIKGSWFNKLRASSPVALKKLSRVPSKKSAPGISRAGSALVKSAPERSPTSSLGSIVSPVHRRSLLATLAETSRGENHVKVLSTDFEEVFV